MKSTKKKVTAALMALAFVAGAAVPVLSFASSGGQYGSFFECLRHCAGSCNFAGRCFLIER
jgi:cytochrome c biogenesis protein CcdA